MAPVILLRITVGSSVQDVRSGHARVLLGSGRRADVRRRDAGWRADEAVLTHAGTALLLSRPGRPGTTTVRVGDVVHLGRAQVALLGLLPRGAVAAAAATAAPAGPVAFGGYDEAAPSPAAAAAAPASPATASSEPAPAWHRDEDWSEALYGALRKSPFLGLSIALHAVVILAALLLLPGPRVERSRGAGDLAVSVGDPAPDEEPLPAVPPAPEPSFPDAEPLVLPDPLDPSRLTPLEEAQEPVPHLAAPDAARATPLDIGLTPNLSAIGARTPRRLPAATVDLRESFTKSDAGRATERAAGMIRAQLGAGAGGKGEALDRLTRHDILVVYGAFDHVGRVLDALRLPYTLVQPHALTLPQAPDLSQHKVVFWNCGESQPRDRQRLLVRRIREFVERGGYFFSTDWAIANVIAPAFPGYVESSGQTAPLPESVVDIEPTPESRDHPLLDGVFRPGVAGSWWLETASFDIRVLKPDDVQVLIRSRELQQRFPRAGPVAITFAHGRGRVLHVMGHYYQEAGNLAGTVAAQRLALNFVLMRLAQD